MGAINWPMASCVGAIPAGAFALIASRGRGCRLPRPSGSTACGSTAFSPQAWSMRSKIGTQLAVTVSPGPKVARAGPGPLSEILPL